MWIAAFLERAPCSTLACIGAAALLVEGYAFCLGRRLAGRIQVAARLDCRNCGDKARCIWWARRLLALRWPGARLEIQGADREEIKQAQILCAGGGSFGEHSQTAGTGNGGRDRGNADL